MARRVAFYAPLKSPNHPIPSGDREIGRLMMQALRHAGFDVELVSEVISYQKRPSQQLFEQRREAVQAEQRRLCERYRRHADARPDLWFTYHPYCKSPDWLGPPLCRQFAIPYVTAEACRTRQATDADWRTARAAVQDAVRLARINFVLKDSDWAYLQSFLSEMQSAHRIAPFLDIDAQPPPGGTLPYDLPQQRPLLFAAGMMRPGAKTESYRVLTEALRGLDQLDWSLVIAGDGPQRDQIEEGFAFLTPDRMRFLGSVAHDHMFLLMDRADLFVWPGISEAIGMVFLEAQSRGTPVAALATAGVPLAVSDGVGGLLSPPEDVMAYRMSLKKLLTDADLRSELGAGGRAYVRRHHDVSAVATLFRKTLNDVLT